METEVLDRLVARMLSIHEASPTPYDRDEIERLIRLDPELFNRFRRRASTAMYLIARLITRGERLWIALNLTRSVETTPRCYFCDEGFTRADVLAGTVHLEHFLPRSMDGDHHAGNITLACDQCNRLKSNLQPEDFERMLNDPDRFFADCPRLRGRRQRLLAFAEISAPHYKGLSWLGQRLGVPSSEWRRTWEDLRAVYRRGATLNRTAGTWASDSHKARVDRIVSPFQTGTAVLAIRHGTLRIVRFVSVWKDRSDCDIKRRQIALHDSPH